MNIGIDIVSISRIEKSYKKYGINFLKKIFSNLEISEIERIENIKRKIEKISGMFAAKEAVIKCFNGKLFFKDIEINYNRNGMPVAKLREKEIKISISHEKEYAVAVALNE